MSAILLLMSDNWKCDRMQINLINEPIPYSVSQKSLTLSNICSISKDNESKTCSLSNGEVSADELATGELPILLYATSFKSISFSSFLACFRSTRQTMTNHKGRSWTLKIWMHWMKLLTYHPNSAHSWRFALFTRISYIFTIFRRL